MFKRKKNRWSNVLVPQMMLWSVFCSLAVSFFVQHFADKVGASFEEEIAQIDLKHHAAYGGPSNFPAFGCSIEPFGSTPHWGVMRSNAKLQRSYCEISVDEHIAAPDYNMNRLTTPLSELQRRTDPEATQLITEKLFYSTRYMGEKDLDSHEYSVLEHPAIDIKMPQGTPVRALAGGRVNDVGNNPSGLGRYVIIEHRLPGSNERIFSIYGHMEKTIVEKDEVMKPGQLIGTVGNTGNSSLPHLHLQIDKYRGGLVHIPYVPGPTSTKTDIARWTMHPMDFIEQY